MATNRTYYIDEDNSWPLDFEGAKSFNYPKLKYGDKVPFALKIRSMQSGTIANSNWSDATTFRAAFVQDFDHTKAPGALTAGFTGAVTAVTVDGFASAPPACGFIRLVNDAGLYESLYYSSYSGTWASSATVLTFAVDATLANTYLTDDLCEFDVSPPMARALNADIISTGKATGDFTVTLDALNGVFELAIGKTEKLAAWLEFVGIDGSGYEIHSVIVQATALNSGDPMGGAALTGPLSLFDLKADKTGTSDIEITDHDKGLILADRSNGKRYRLCMTNGILGMEEMA